MHCQTRIKVRYLVICVISSELLLSFISFPGLAREQYLGLSYLIYSIIKLLIIASYSNLNTSNFYSYTTHFYFKNSFISLWLKLLLTKSLTRFVSGNISCMHHASLLYPTFLIYYTSFL